LRLRVSVVVFPGSNCDRDALHAAETVMRAEARFVWHQDRDLGRPDLVILPGGFSYGDYLRCGAMARFSPVMESVVTHAERGGAVLGICNGFQVLCEAGLLSGVLFQNAGLRFVCREVRIRVESTGTPFTSAVPRGTVLRMPVAHGDGNWNAAPDVLREMEAHDQVVFRYVDADGQRAPGATPNGSLDDVAGVRNRRGNVLGLMPHPERAAEAILGSVDGARLFASFVRSAA
jgi:phosphoribosylformylglycinamidine synthase subunit PurQ / glutaminase